MSDRICRYAAMETLESRQLCSGTADPVRHLSSYDSQTREDIPAVTQITYDRASGLKIVGTDGDDRVSITEGVSNGKPVVKFAVTIIFKGAFGQRRTVIERFEMDKSEIGLLPSGNRVHFTGKAGDDFFRYNFPYGSSGMSVGADGGPGMDTLFGGPQADILIGGDATDHLYGLGGSDLLVGQGGDDTLSGGDGDDILIGNAGQDTLDGGNGSDVLDGGQDGVSDHLFGMDGKDLFVQDLYWEGIKPANWDTPGDFRDWTEDNQTTIGWEAPVTAATGNRSGFSTISIVTQWIRRADDATRLSTYLDSLRNLWGPVNLSGK